MNDNEYGQNLLSTKHTAIKRYLKHRHQYYLTLQEAVDALPELNIHTNVSQLQSAASPDTFGVKRLPFFTDPATKYEIIDQGVLVGFYSQLQLNAILATL